MVEDLFKTDKDLDLIKDGDVNYFVMNATDNKFTLDWLARANDILDRIEKGNEPGVMVTVGTGPKIFHTGFDLDLWNNDKLQQYENFSVAFNFFARVLTFSIPTMAAINGHAFAGGLIHALTHD